MLTRNLQESFQGRDLSEQPHQLGEVPQQASELGAVG
jgi:hypothetical protein